MTKKLEKRFSLSGCLNELWLKLITFDKINNRHAKSDPIESFFALNLSKDPLIYNHGLPSNWWNAHLSYP